MIEKEVLIYSDLGVCQEGALQIERALFEDLRISTRRIDAKELLKGRWQKNTSSLIMPGGRDIFYHKALYPQGTKILREFVEEGGTYLGICAGAYFASAMIEFEKGGDLEVLGTRDLGFFPGVAIGPAYGLGKFGYLGGEGSRVAQLRLGQEVVSAYFHGGCFFSEAEKFSDVTIIASYQDIPKNPAAMISCKRGRGLAVLSGVHWEHPLTERRSLLKKINDKSFDLI